MTVWIDLEHAAALYVATQLQLAGGGPAECIPVVKWLFRHSTRYFTERNVRELWTQAESQPHSPGHWETHSVSDYRWQFWIRQ